MSVDNKLYYAVVFTKKKTMNVWKNFEVSKTTTTLAISGTKYSASTGDSEDLPPQS